MGRVPDDGDPFPDRWTVYLASDDAAATTAKASGAGGKVFVEPMAVGDLGTMAVLADVGGVMDSPYGRLAGLTDPTGAHFSIGGNVR
ncbi:hypothetical protein ACFVVM_20115 [Nocardia sp. NPDC058176]|uniref:hypothetical protein n=1 Tax=Nocardia sp. NPDC058176 TaxID=3346368 RepID=UPI0036DBD8A1